MHFQQVNMLALVCVCCFPNMHLSPHIMCIQNFEVMELVRSYLAWLSTMKWGQEMLACMLVSWFYLSTRWSNTLPHLGTFPLIEELIYCMFWQIYICEVENSLGTHHFRSYTRLCFSLSSFSSNSRSEPNLNEMFLRTGERPTSLNLFPRYAFSVQL